MDIRSIITQQRIQEALLLLLEEKSFAACSVSDIVINAEVSKKSFYSYYESKFDLIKQIEDKLIDGLKQALEKDRLHLTRIQQEYSPEKIDEIADVEFDQTIKYCDENKLSFSRLLSSNGDISFINRLEKIGTQEIIERLPYYFGSCARIQSTNDTYSMKIIRMLYSHIIVGLLCFWMSHSDIMSIQEVKSLVTLAQQKSPLELMAYYRHLYETNN